MEKPTERYRKHGKPSQTTALAAALLGLIGCADYYPKSVASVRSATRTCLYENVPGFSAQICNPTFSEQLVKDFSSSCPGVDDLDEQIPESTQWQIGGPHVVSTVGEAVRTVFNEECKDVMRGKEQSGSDTTTIVPIIIR